MKLSRAIILIALRPDSFYPEVSIRTEEIRHLNGRTRGLSIAASILFLSALAAQAQVSGFVADFEGKAPLKAHVEVFTPDRPETPQRFDVSAGGAFDIPLNQSGLIRLNFTAAFHEPSGVALLLLKSDKVRLDVRLKPYDWVNDLKDVRVIGDFNGFSRDSGAAALRPLADGTYFADVDFASSGKMGYRLIGLVQDSPLSVPGTYFDEMTLDSNGRYVSVLNVSLGRVRILFDPARLPWTGRKAEIHFGEPGSRAARVAAIDRDITRHQRDYHLALSAFRAAGHPEQDFLYDWSDTLASLKQRLIKEKDTYVRQALLIELLSLGKLGCSEVGRRTARQALIAIPPDSPVWELGPGSLLFDTIQMAGGLGAYRSYFQKVVTGNPSRETRALALEQAYYEAVSAKDLDRARDYYRRLTSEFADLLPGQRVKSKPPESKFAVGKPMPAFEFAPLVSGGGGTLNNAAFQGKYVLIDFWATWCAPCVAEMANLHALQAKYQNKNFIILSVSFDKAPDDVRQFREKSWPMPWSQAFVGMDEFRVGSEVCDYFELSDIPKPILVDPSGKVAAVGAEALGEPLARVLAVLLGD